MRSTSSGSGSLRRDLVGEEIEERELFFPQGLELAVDLFGDLGFDGIEHGAAEVDFEDGGVDVALAADGGGVAEAVGHGLDGLDDVLFGLGFGFEGLELAQEHGGEDGAGPGAEVLGGEVLAGDLLEILIDVG